MAGLPTPDSATREGFFHTHKEEIPIWIVATAAFLSGSVGMLRGLILHFPEYPAFLTMIVPIEFHHYNRSLALMSGFLLIYLSFNLLERKRTAWWLAICVSCISVISHVAHGDFLHIALVPVVTIILLFFFRRKFTVRSEPRDIMQGILFMTLALLVAFIYGTLGFYLMDMKDFGINFALSDALGRTLREFTLVGNDDLIPHTRHASWFLDSLRGLGVLTILVSAYSLFRPVAFRLRTLPGERELAKGILERQGTSSMDFFKLWSDKSYFFSDGKNCVIAYRVAGGVAVSLGDPVGPPEEIETTIRKFLRFCSDNGWSVAFHETLPDLIPLYRRMGFHVLKIGEEAVVDLERFCTHTIEDKELRRRRRKFEKEGYTLARYLPPHPERLFEETHEISDEWLSLPGRRERGFTLGNFSRDYLQETPLYVLRDSSGRLMAFVNEIPSYREGEATIDMMRHRSDLPNGAMDYLFAGLFFTLRSEGFARFNLGLAAFSGVGDHPGATFEERVLHQVFEHFNGLFSFKGLREYKSKFEPVWEDRFLVYHGGPAGLLKVAMALTRITEVR